MNEEQVKLIQDMKEVFDACEQVDPDRAELLFRAYIDIFCADNDTSSVWKIVTPKPEKGREDDV